MPWQPRPPGSCWQRREGRSCHARGWGAGSRGGATAGGPRSGVRGRGRGWRVMPGPGKRQATKVASPLVRQLVQPPRLGAEGHGPGARGQEPEGTVRAQRSAARPLTSAPSPVFLRLPCHRHDLHDKPVPALADQSHHLLVSNLHHVHPVDLGQTGGWAGAVQACPPGAQRSHRPGQQHGLTSMRKSPVRSPALQATPSTSTDSRYCSAGKAGVGVNSSMGVSAAGEERALGQHARAGGGRSGGQRGT